MISIQKVKLEPIRQAPDMLALKLRQFRGPAPLDKIITVRNPWGEVKLRVSV